jgi:sterol desaturase/sphingolipid hydroxylase (fatty acid hydroxylase superfamily)
MDAILICLSIPFFLMLMALELWIGRRRGRALYRFQDSISNLGNGIGSEILGTWLVPISAGIYTLVWQHARVATQSPKSVLAWVVLFFAVDLAYYVFHRASHRINFLWASHAVHHQSEEYNLSVALRQSWFGSLFSWVFYVPLAVAGFPPWMYLLTHTTNTLYQFWIHTRLVNRLGPLEWFLNTPSHHRVHHGVNPRYIDKNYAGILIIWDRLFGTYVPEGDEPVYGLVKPLASWDAVRANVQVWIDLAKMARATRRWRDKLLVWVMPPEWRPADLGGPVVVPEPGDREKFAVAPERARDRFVAVQFLLVTAATAYFLYAQATVSRAITVAIGLGVLLVIGWWGVLYRSTRPAGVERHAGVAAQPSR